MSIWFAAKKKNPNFTFQIFQINYQEYSQDLGSISWLLPGKEHANKKQSNAMQPIFSGWKSLPLNHSPTMKDELIQVKA